MDALENELKDRAERHIIRDFGEDYLPASATSTSSDEKDTGPGAGEQASAEDEKAE
jgi:hypothetical protein